MEKEIEELWLKLEDWGAEPREVFGEIFMNDSSLYLRCLNKFLDEEGLVTLRASLVPEKKEVAVRIVHTMKGNSDCLGLFPLMDKAMIVLNDLRKDDFGLAGIHLPQLEVTFREVKKIFVDFQS